MRDAALEVGGSGGATVERCQGFGELAVEGVLGEGTGVVGEFPEPLAGEVLDDGDDVEEGLGAVEGGLGEGVVFGVGGEGGGFDGAVGEGGVEELDGGLEDEVGGAGFFGGGGEVGGVGEEGEGFFDGEGERGGEAGGGGFEGDQDCRLSIADCRLRGGRIADFRLPIADWGSGVGGIWIRIIVGIWIKIKIRIKIRIGGWEEEVDGAGDGGEGEGAEGAMESGEGLVAGGEIFGETGGEEDGDVVFFGEGSEGGEDGAGMGIFEFRFSIFDWRGGAFTD